MQGVGLAKTQAWRSRIRADLGLGAGLRVSPSSASLQHSAQAPDASFTPAHSRTQLRLEPIWNFNLKCQRLPPPSTHPAWLQLGKPEQESPLPLLQGLARRRKSEKVMAMGGGGAGRDESRCRCEEPVKGLMKYREKLLVPNPIFLELPKPETHCWSQPRKRRMEVEEPTREIPAEAPHGFVCRRDLT